MISVKNLSRRNFLKGTLVSGGSALVLAASGSANPAKAAFLPPEVTKFTPNVFVEISRDGGVLITVARTEMGQGTRTAMTQLVVEELEVAWDQVKIRQGDADERYGDQFTEGSTSVRTQWEPLRKAGASARLMLIGAGAAVMGVEANECLAKDGQVIHKGSGRKLDYGKLVEKAAEMPVPKEIPLKSGDFKVIGKPIPGIDLDDMVSGNAGYGIDVQIPGMKYAGLERCPVRGGKIKSMDDKAALAVKGVRKVFTLDPVGPPANTWASVVVVGDNTWAVLKGRRALKIEWDYGSNAAENTQKYETSLRESAGKEGKIVRQDGDITPVFANAERVVEASFDAPYLAHSPMEPPVCTARVEGDTAEVWLPSQTPGWAKEAASKALGVDPSKVTVHVTLAGGGFGRKSKPDFVTEAVLAAKKAGMPLKVVWTREDEVRHGFYRSQSCQLLRAAVDEKGKPTAWLHRSAFPTISSTFNPAADHPSPSEMSQGATTIPFDIPNISVQANQAVSCLRIGWLRSVHHTFHAWAVNCFVDELAAAAGRDPIDYYQDLVGKPRILEFSERDKKVPFKFDTARLNHVVDMVRKHSDWGKKTPKGRGLGFAAHYSFYSYVAMVADVGVDTEGNLKINKFTAVVDCGTVVNPDSAKAQIEGAIAFGLSAALHGEITIKDGRVVQSNFHDYPMLRINEMPEVEVHLVESSVIPTGIGEPGVPPTAPALCNAIFAATGKRHYRMPLPKKLV